MVWGFALPVLKREVSLFFIILKKSERGFTDVHPCGLFLSV